LINKEFRRSGEQKEERLILFCPPDLLNSLLINLSGKAAGE
jgi:hypothetical protein